MCKLVCAICVSGKLNNIERTLLQIKMELREELDAVSQLTKAKHQNHVLSSIENMTKYSFLKSIPIAHNG